MYSLKSLFRVKEGEKVQAWHVLKRKFEGTVVGFESHPWGLYLRVQRDDNGSVETVSADNYFKIVTFNE